MKPQVLPRYRPERKLIKLEQIKALNIEMSSRCSGRCPFCSRGQKVRSYGNHEITLSDFKQLPAELIGRLNWVSFSGNFGDLSMNRETPAVADYIKNLNPAVELGGDTNGSVQNEKWWAQLGRFFRDGSMVFSLDGLEDTHAIHRVGTDYRKIIRNIRAFTRAGGVAHWKFILFEHNEHQVEQARETARQIGCSRFFVVASRDYDEKCRPPKNTPFEIKRSVFRAYEQKLSSSQAVVRCKPLANGSLYIAADGTVHPCCFAHLMHITEHNRLFDFILPLAQKFYPDINFKTTPLEEILNGPYFKEILKQTGKNEYCRIKCNQFRKTVKKELLLTDVYF